MLNIALKLNILQKFPSQVEFAIKLEISESVVSRVIRGRIVLNDREKKIWANVLDCTVDQVFPESLEKVV